MTDQTPTPIHYKMEFLQGSTFTAVSLADAVLKDSHFMNATFDDNNLTGLTVTEANMTGMTIDGILVSDLLAKWNAQ